jgi:hypothetical protein
MASRAPIRGKVRFDSPGPKAGASGQRQVATLASLRRSGAREVMSGSRANTGGMGKKIPSDEGYDFGFWWRMVDHVPTGLPSV